MTGIYKITNKINGKAYIGQSINITVRWNEHYLCSNNLTDKNSSAIHFAISKYGIENFTFEVLALCAPEELDEAEMYFINYYKTKGENGYNKTDGGESNPMIGEHNGNSKMTNEDVYNIRESYANGELKHKVYEQYRDKISINTFSDIWIGKTWKHIHCDVYTDSNKKFQRTNRDYKKSHEKQRVLSDEQILHIRDCKNNGLQRKYVHDTFYPNININTFSDIWYNHTFQHLQSCLPIKPQKKYRKIDQDGTKNHMAKLTEEEVLEIRAMRDNGCKIEEVYPKYSHKIKMCSLRNVWNNKTYRNIKQTDL